MQILMTGYRGLIGRYLKPLLEHQGYVIHGFDIIEGNNITNALQLENALEGIQGVIHLAAVSRVVWAQKKPELCWQTNALASEQLLKLSAKSKSVDWVLLTSSREIYGQARTLPVSETTAINPINIYGKSKAYMEAKAFDIRESGLNTAVVRLSNVYGCTQDHSDRILPAFCRSAVEGKNLRADGLQNLFDFTYIWDAVSGLARMVELLINNERYLPAIHLLTGIGITIEQAAEMAISGAGSCSKIIKAAPRTYDVSRFFGNPEKAKSLLGWQANITPQQGITMLVNAFEKQMESLANEYS